MASISALPPRASRLRLRPWRRLGMVRIKHKDLCSANRSRPAERCKWLQVRNRCDLSHDASTARLKHRCRWTDPTLGCELIGFEALCRDPDLAGQVPCAPCPGL